MDEQLLLRYLYQECTKEELIQISQWVSSDKANADWMFEMERVWLLKDELRFSDKKEIGDAYNRFLSSISEKKNGDIRHSPRKPGVKLWLRSAAAIFLLGLLSLNIYQYITAEQISGKENIIEVPRGQKVSLTLSDGTKVWLNSDSRFSYPSGFSAKTRTVKLQGEGYFEVAHDDKLPFVVDGWQICVKVLGTKFNMNSYPDETTTVVLKEGKVEVYTPDNATRMTLHPNEQVRYSTATGMLFSRDADTIGMDSWRSGKLTFTENTLKEIMNVLERKYDAQVTITNPSLEKELFTCHTKAEATLEQVLELLKDTHRLDYKTENKKVIILKKE
ncbi:FecR family protein [Dysgonomonas sp.]